jgi:predicted HTH domain antitoxin
MTFTIPDDILQKAGLTEREALVEFACRLFDAGKLPLWPAARLAALSRGEMEDELRKRNIPIWRITPEYWAEELGAIEHLKKLGI